MRTKLFRSFLIIILTALLSNFIFQWLIVKDFDRYVNSVKEDRFRWIVASVESAYLNGEWDQLALSDSLHWAMMLGIEAKIADTQGREIFDSEKAMASLSETMKHDMADLFYLEAGGGTYADYPLALENKRIGTFFFRPFAKKEIREKEKTFKRKTKYFLYISFVIAGISASLLALLLSQYLSKPLSNLKKAAEKIAGGNFGTRIPLAPDQGTKPTLQRAFVGAKHLDEIGSLSESFNFMAESLQREETLRKNLLSSVSHELRTPLTIIKAHLEALEDGLVDDREAAFRTVKSQIEKLIELISGIEDLTVAEGSFLKRNESIVVNLKEFLSDFIEDMLPLMREKALTLEMTQGRDVVVTTDAEKLEKIVRNLLSNSIKFTKEGGIKIDYGRQGETFFVEIKDTGKGISEEHLPLIFNRFYRAEKSETTGLGLGLAIVKELVDALGGRIEVQSKIEEGTAFRVYLPLNPLLKSS
jgi:two-component system, OmpR family, sensor histidine kinase BaeS